MFKVLNLAHVFRSLHQFLYYVLILKAVIVSYANILYLRLTGDARPRFTSTIHVHDSSSLRFARGAGAARAKR